MAQTGVVARWSGPPEPPGIDIVGYRVIVTREDPLRIYSVDLPASARRVPVPAAFLEPGTEHGSRSGDRGERQPDLHDDLLRGGVGLGEEQGRRPPPC